MKNLRWANTDQKGVCYDNDNIVVYLDSGEEYEAILKGDHGPIGEPVVLEGTVKYTVEELRLLRREAYQKEADPLFFKWQRGEALQQQWLDKIDAIKLRYPSQETTVNEINP